MEIKIENGLYKINGAIATTTVDKMLLEHKILEYPLKPVPNDFVDSFRNYSYIPKTNVGNMFIEWVDRNVMCGDANLLVGMEYESISIATSIDIIGVDNNKDKFIMGMWCGSKDTIPYESFAYKLSMQDYMLTAFSNHYFNGRKIYWTKSKHLYVCAYTESTLDIVEIKSIPNDDLTYLLKCEIKGERFQRKKLYLEDAFKEEWIRQEKEWLQLSKELAQKREYIHKEMKRQKFTGTSEEDYSISIIPPMDELVLDSHAIKKNYPSIYESCQKMVKHKENIEIKINK